VLSADQLVRGGDTHNVGHAVEALQVERLEPVRVADEPDDGPAHPAADEGIAPCGADHVYYCRDVPGSGIKTHYYNHHGSFVAR